MIPLWEKSPLSSRFVGTLTVASSIVLVLYPSNDAQKKVLSFRMGPPSGAAVQVEVGCRLLARPRAVLARLAAEEGQRPRLARPVLPQEAPVPGVRPRLARHVEDAAAGAPHLRVVGGDLDLDFLHRLDRGDDGRAVADVDDGHAVERVVVAAPRSAPEREQRGVGLVLLPDELRVAGVGHAGRDGREEERVAARRGQGLRASRCRGCCPRMRSRSRAAWPGSRP